MDSSIISTSGYFDPTWLNIEVTEVEDSKFEKSLHARISKMSHKISLSLNKNAVAKSDNSGIRIKEISSQIKKYYCSGIPFFPGPCISKPIPPEESQDNPFPEGLSESELEDYKEKLEAVKSRQLAREQREEAQKAKSEKYNNLFKSNATPASFEFPKLNSKIFSLTDNKESYSKYYEIDLIISAIVFLKYLCRPKEKTPLKHAHLFPDEDNRFITYALRDPDFYIPYNFNPTYTQGKRFASIDSFSTDFIEHCLVRKKSTPWYQGEGRITYTQYNFDSIIDLSSHNKNIEDYYLFELLTGANLSISMFKWFDYIPQQNVVSFIPRLAAEMTRCINIYGRASMLDDYFRVTIGDASKLDVNSINSILSSMKLVRSCLAKECRDFPFLLYLFINLLLEIYEIKQPDNDSFEISTDNAQSAIIDLTAYLKTLSKTNGFRYILTKPSSPNGEIEVPSEYIDIYKSIENKKNINIFPYIEKNVSEQLSSTLEFKTNFVISKENSYYADLFSYMC